MLDQLAGCGKTGDWQGYLNVLVITLIFSLVQWLVVERWELLPRQVAIEPEARNALPGEAEVVPVCQTLASVQEQGPIAPRLKRMPEGLDGDIFCLQMEDHYLCVHGTGGIANGCYSE